MAYRKQLLIVLLTFSVSIAKSQVNYQLADSTSYALYQDGKWEQLIAFGKQSAKSEIDFPLLRLRIAYAQFITGNFSGALEQYQQVLKGDSHNQIARYYSFLCNKYLNRNPVAFYHASYLDSISLVNEKLSPYGMIDLGLESSFKFSDNAMRGAGSYSRVFLSNRLGYKLQLEQSVAFYSQSIFVQSQFGRLPSTNKQFEYYAKLGYALSDQFLLTGAYHYLGINYQQIASSGNMGSVGLKFSKPYFDLQGDVSLSNIAGKSSTQYNGRLSLYPRGNLNLYTLTSVAYQQQSGTNRIIAGQALGYKVVKKNFWIENSVTLGTLDNYLEAQGLYIYNAIDVTKFKTRATAFYQLSTHKLLTLNYMYEQKQDSFQNLNYNQHSITGGFTWKF